MNIKDLLLPLGLALLTTWAIQYFFFGGKNQQAEQDRSGQGFVAPSSPVEYKPLVREIDFIDDQRAVTHELTTIETSHARYVFSNEGACLYQFDVKREINGVANKLTTIYPLADEEREGRCFLLALPAKTPYYYNLIDRHDEPGLTSISYKYESDEIAVIKKYTIFDDTYRIDVEIAIEPKNKQLLTARLIFPSPYMPEAASHETVNGLIAGAQGSMQKIPSNKITAQSGWFAPALFGSDNKYFVHASVDNAQSMIQRGYYAAIPEKLLSFIESGVITGKTVWNLSFYIGPKEEQALVVVNKRLEEALDYSGWLAPIAKIALALLKWLYSYLKNYGLAIIALTVLLKLMMIPFTWRAEESVKKRAEFQKKLQYVQQKYKHDAEMLAQERAELIKKHGMPGMSGCLPLLLQIPVFFALNRVLSSSIELYKAPFIGWITDLSATDPYYILPAFIVIMMIMHALSADRQQRFAGIAMALVFGAISANLAAGLCLYILVSTLLSVMQTGMQKFFKRATS